MPIDYTMLYCKALNIAAQFHGTQVRKYTGEPYINHCQAVATLVRERTSDPEIVAAALLHDTLEDTNASELDLANMFGGRITNLVCELTDAFTKSDYPNLNRAERKQREAARLGQISDDAKLIKLCDLIDNTRTIVCYDPDFAVVYLREKADILEAMGYGHR